MASAKRYFHGNQKPGTLRSLRATMVCSSIDTPSTLISYRWCSLGRNAQDCCSYATTRTSRGTQGRTACTTRSATCTTLQKGLIL